MPPCPRPSHQHASNRPPDAGQAAPGDRWAAFDALPAPLRVALRDALLPWSAVEVLAELVRQRRAGLSEAGAVAAILARLVATEAAERAAFYQRTWGRSPPGCG